MIILVHNNVKVIDLYSTDKNNVIVNNLDLPFFKIVIELASTYPNELLIWVHKDFKTALNIEGINDIFHHKLIMASYAVSGQYSISKQIGYVEHKPYTNVPKDVRFPTWLMSSDAGGIHCQVLANIKGEITELDFDFILSSIAKQAMPKGLFCYSEPKLLKSQVDYMQSNSKPSTGLLFKFVKKHYKPVWYLNLFLCFVLFEKRFPLVSFLKNLFSKTLNLKIDFSGIKIASNAFKPKKEIDVIIPTIGREQYLYDVLKDLSSQTLLPVNVVIVEQNPDKNAISKLEYLNTEKWPFKIKHHFTHQTGACNARNIAINLVESEWTFLADDDIRFKNDLIENAFNIIEDYGEIALNLLCLQPNEKQSYFTLSQTDVFGSGTSIIKSSLFKKAKFDMSFEFGFGEDSDFGMQIRNQGTDIIFVPSIEITHLKAPIGGFRTIKTQQWDDEVLQPKPSPTIMLFLLKHFNTFQKNGYKFVLFLKFYKSQKVKNPFKYLKNSNLRWANSEKWAKILEGTNET